MTEYAVSLLTVDSGILLCNEMPCLPNRKEVNSQCVLKLGNVI